MNYHIKWPDLAVIEDCLYQTLFAVFCSVCSPLQGALYCNLSKPLLFIR